MIRDIVEIKKIGELYPIDISNESSIENCIKKVCLKVSDEYGEEKSEYCSKEFNEIRTFLGDSLNYVAKICSIGNCSDCPIKKWCNAYRNEQQIKELTTANLTYADFFCGAGGLSLGFMQEGYHLSLANDIQECCIDTYRFNHPSTPSKHIIQGDIKEILGDIDKYLRYLDVDVVVGGPPCQGFSMANRQRLIDDPRNYLYKSYIKAVSLIKPKWVVMENVRGILKVEDQIKEDYRKIGYEVKAHILNAKDFGVPQNRERVIFIGNRIGFDNEKIFERLKEISYDSRSRTLSDALYGLNSLQAKEKVNSTTEEDDKSGYTICKCMQTNDNDYIEEINDRSKNVICFNHKARYNNPRDIEIFSRLKPGDNSADPKIADIMPYKRRNGIFKDKYYKLEPDRPCKTITAHMKYDCNMYIHPTQSRGLTPREAARIQSYPDDYYFRGAYTTTFMQVGNSVPPILGRAIAKSIKEALKKDDSI